MRFLGIVLSIVQAATTFAEPDRTFQLDPVELVRGSEVSGDAAIAADHHQFTYLFTTEENRAEFLRHPAQYEIQLGGACGRMGPLSGAGRMDLFAMHDGRLYLFASEACRKTFLAGPEKFLDHDDPVPVVTNESAQRGRALIELAVQGVGGAARLDAARSYHEQMIAARDSGGTTYRVRDSLTLRFPDGVRSDSCWDASCWGSVATAAGGWFVESEGGTRSMHGQQHVAQMREGRHVLSILRARHEPGFSAVAEGPRRIHVPGKGEIELESFSVALNGTTTTLGIDPAGGEIRWMAYRGRGPSAALGWVEKVFSDFHEVGGLRVPSTVAVSFDGEVVAEQSGAFTSQSVDDSSDLPKFERGGQLREPLVHEAIIDAPVADVWCAFTTSEGIRSWMVPVGEVELRVGGEFRTSYNPDAILGDDSTIINRILSFEPQRMLSIQNVKAPAGFPNASLFQQTWSVIHFQPIGGDRTHLRLVGMGYGDGPEWDDLYHKFEVGNQYTLDRLKAKFAEETPASSPDAPSIPDALQPLARFVGGQWVTRSQWADGSDLHAREVSEWSLGGRFLSTKTFVIPADSCEYQRYETIYSWDEAKQQLATHTFAFDGKVSRGVVEVRGDGSLSYPPEVQPDGTEGGVKQQIRFTGPDAFIWTVWVKDGEAWNAIIEAEWKREPLPPDSTSN